jgi:hypothetical protein
MPALLVTVLAAVALAGCGDEGTADANGGGGGGGGGGPVACTEIGCASGLYLDLRPLDHRLPAARRVRICVADQCRTFGLGGANIADMRVAGLKERDRVRVRMTVLGEDGRALRRSTVTAPVRRSKPNGPRCPPTCFQVAVRIDRDSLRLEPTS